MSAFEPTTLENMQAALDAAWDEMSDVEQEHSSRSQLAARILAAAEDGERDIDRLTAAALGTYYNVMMN